MKKEYINPEIQIVKIETLQMIAGSGDGPQALGGEETNQESDLLSRRGFWDDDEDY